MSNKNSPSIKLSGFFCYTIYMKICSTCDTVRRPDEFYKSAYRQCKECVKSYSSSRIKRMMAIPNEREKVILARRKNKIKRKFNISEEEYKNIYKRKQQCEICKTTDNKGKPFCIDHNHGTGIMRGLLCNKCNLGISFFNDDPVISNNMTKYLKKYQQQK